MPSMFLATQMPPDRRTVMCLVTVWALLLAQVAGFAGPVPTAEPSGCEEFLEGDCCCEMARASSLGASVQGECCEAEAAPDRESAPLCSCRAHPSDGNSLPWPTIGFSGVGEEAGRLLARGLSVSSGIPVAFSSTLPGSLNRSAEGSRPDGRSREPDRAGPSGTPVSRVGELLALIAVARL